MKEEKQAASDMTASLEGLREEVATLRAAVRERDDFISIAAHELRNPITPLVGQIEPIPDLLKAVNDASGRAFALWITFLTAMVYLAISVGTTTNLQLLLGGPVKLPLLGVDLPLFAFYKYAPPMFVVLHLYVLMQLYLLAHLLWLFDDDLRAADMIEPARRRVRGQLDKFVFTQFLIGGAQEWIVRLFLQVGAWLSFVIGPVFLLIGFQLSFLPYHDLAVTYVHRSTVLIDLALLLLLWPKLAKRNRGRRNQSLAF